MKKILITGLGSKVAWKIRAAELGKAMGARVKPHATLRDMQDADIVVVCKWYTPDLIHEIKKWGGPWAWDIVDAYPQPEAYQWNADMAKTWLRNTLFDLHPKCLVAATQQMMDDAQWPGFALPHHARPKQKGQPMRESVINVGYEGQAKYLGGWRHILEQECEARGWTFHVNPEHLHDMDIVVAFRDKGGYVGRSWKSAVKLTNAHDLAIPVVCGREAGYMENASGMEVWADTKDELTAGFDYLTPLANRMKVRASFMEHRRKYSIDVIAHRYRLALEAACR